MKVAIPSYQRAETLKAKTLKFLLEEGFDPKDIYVFVSNEQELVTYKRVIDTPLNWVVCPVNSDVGKRTHMKNFFPIGEEILSVDDDVKRIKFLENKPVKPFVERMFQLCKEEKVTLWGIYPVNQTNMFYCKERLVKGNLYCIGCFWGIVNVETEDFPEVNGKADKWLSCVRIKRDGATLRYDGACPDTSYYVGKGGMTEQRTYEMEEKSSQLIANQFPDLVRYKLKKNGHPDVEFIRKRPTLLPHSLSSPPHQ